jgi:hypothetical protein
MRTILVGQALPPANCAKRGSSLWGPLLALWGQGFRSASHQPKDLWP